MEKNENYEPFSKRKCKKYVKTSLSKKMNLIKLYYEDRILLKEAAKMMNINYSSAKTILRTYRNSKKKCVEIVNSQKDSNSIKGKCFLIYKEDPESYQSNPLKTETNNSLIITDTDPNWEKIKNLIINIDHFVKGIHCNWQTSQQTLNFLIYLIYSIYNNKHII
jgi:hypothetical protein